jgi:hypothetical protein
MHEFIECRHIMTNGRKCRAAALRGKPFCFHHAKLHFRGSGRPKLRVLAGSDFQDVKALRRATAKALEALSSPLVDTRRAGLLLYGLHLAANLDKRMSALAWRNQDDLPSSPEPAL